MPVGTVSWVSVGPRRSLSCQALGSSLGTWRLGDLGYVFGLRASGFVGLCDAAQRSRPEVKAQKLKKRTSLNWHGMEEINDQGCYRVRVE
jgi:hypothetical protein